MRVAIVGAGPSGLISCKYLVQLGISPTVFDLESDIGGMWNSQSNRYVNFLWLTFLNGFYNSIPFIYLL